MAEATTIARPYADAVYQLAKVQGQEASWGDRLARLAAAVQDPEARSFLADPDRPTADKNALLRDVLGDGHSAETGNFVTLLLENQRWSLAPEIAALYVARTQAEAGQVEAVVKSAVPLDEARVSAVQEALGRRLGRRVLLRAEADPALIGGLVIEAGDLVIDGSVRGQLEQMARTLRS